MRNILSLLALLICFGAAAQKSEVIALDSAKSKADLYSKTLLWIAKTWKNSSDVIQLKDEAAGTVVVRGGLSSKPVSMGVPADGKTISNITFMVKDGKAKIQFENTRFEYATGTIWGYEEKPPMSGKAYDKWKTNVDAEIEGIIAEYKKFLNEKSDF